jgi:hypothetical protein
MENKQNLREGNKQNINIFLNKSQKTDLIASNASL